MLYSVHAFLSSVVIILDLMRYILLLCYPKFSKGYNFNVLKLLVLMVTFFL